MNYIEIHNYIINRAKNRIINKGYIEKHHIIPKCMGGKNHKKNIVKLTGREHYIIHQLLAKIYPNVEGFITSVIRMSKQCVGSRAYKWLREKHAINTSKRMKGHKYNLGRVRSYEEKINISQTMKGIPKSLETKIKMSAAQLGNKKALGLIRGKMKYEHKQKMIQSKIKRVFINQYDSNGKFLKTFNSIYEAKKEINDIGNNIYKALKNNKLKCKNYYWRYTNE